MEIKKCKKIHFDTNQNVHKKRRTQRKSNSVIISEERLYNNTDNLKKHLIYKLRDSITILYAYLRIVRNILILNKNYTTEQNSRYK